MYYVVVLITAHLNRNFREAWRKAFYQPRWSGFTSSYHHHHHHHQVIFSNFDPSHPTFYLVPFYHGWSLLDEVLLVCVMMGKKYNRRWLAFQSPHLLWAARPLAPALTTQLESSVDIFFKWLLKIWIKKKISKHS